MLGDTLASPFCLQNLSVEEEELSDFDRFCQT